VQDGAAAWNRQCRPFCINQFSLVKSRPATCLLLLAESIDQQSSGTMVNHSPWNISVLTQNDRLSRSLVWISRTTFVEQSDVVRVTNIPKDNSALIMLSDYTL